MSAWVGDKFPWATFTINVSGSFAIGLLSTLLAAWLPAHQVRLFVLVGFLGGYTTFSSFAFEGHVLWERGEIGRALAYLCGSVFTGFVAVLLGVLIGRAVVGPKVSVTQLASADDIRGLDE
jgi:CrcB protein